MGALFLKELLMQRKRLFLTSMAIVWGTISMVLFLAFGEGLKNQFIEGTRGLGVGIVITYGGSTGKAFKGLGTGRPVRLAYEDMNLIEERVPEIDLISGEFQTWGKSYTYDDITTSTRVTGVFPDFQYMRTNYPQPGGRFINQRDIEERRRVVFLGNEIKERLFGENEAVGNWITIDRIPFLVIGVLRKKVQTSSYSGWDSQQGVIPATTYRSLYGSRYFNRIIFRAHDVSKNTMVKARVRQVIASKYRFDPLDTRAIRTWDVAEQENIMGSVLLGIEIFLGIIGGMTLIIAGGGVANMMYVVVRQRTREIGLKIALGAKRRNILFPFLLEAVLIMTSGGLIGIPISILMIKGYESIPMEGLIAEVFGIMKPVVSMDIAIGTVIILGILGMIAGFFPARRAASINPVEALRYE